MHDLGLADRIRAKGVRVQEVAGWQTRGSVIYSPQGSLQHHTAGAAAGAVPSLATVIYGRPGLSGPLCQVLQSREPDGNDIAYIVAAGRANHAGAGSWQGLTGNSSVAGLEVEHTGAGPVDVRRLEISARIQAALLEAPGSTWNAGYCCQHFEWATPRGRKVDFHDLDPYTADTFRERVAYWIGRTADEEEDMPTLDEISAIVRAELDRGQAFGVTPGGYAGTLPEILRVGQANFNQQNANTAKVLAAVGAVDEEVAEKLTGPVTDAVVAAVLAKLPADTIGEDALRGIVRDEVKGVLSTTTLDVAD